MLVAPVLALTAGQSHQHNSVGAELAIGVFFVALAAPGLWMARRLAQAGLWVSAYGLIVRNPLHTYFIALADVEAFASGVLPGNNGTPCPVVKRRQGRSVGVWALGREGVIWRYDRYAREMEPVCDELNDLLDTLRGRRATISAPPARSPLRRPPRAYAALMLRSAAPARSALALRAGSMTAIGKPGSTA